MKKILSLTIGVLLTLHAFAQNISLSGKWKVRLDSLNTGLKENWQDTPFPGNNINLPGTLDDAEIGKKADLDTHVLNKEILTRLTRRHTYVGVAWYSKEFFVPANINSSEIFLERLIWKSDCWIDGRYLGTQESLIAPHIFQTGNLKAGKHTIVLRIDNTKQHDISLRDMAHAYTEGTQIIWNGVIGEMKLIPRDKKYIRDLQVFPQMESRNVKVSIKISGPSSAKNLLSLKVLDGKREIANKILSIGKDDSLINTNISISDVQPWSEFNPKLYHIKAQVTSRKNEVIDQQEYSFGFRDLENSNAHLSLNGNRLFLRGTLDCGSYPLTGHPPMKKEGWLKVFNTAKSYGLNHIRFHSWCPPEAAFKVADSMGFYLQVELPLWELNIGHDKGTLTYLRAEAQKILENYGNHPSFCFFSMGNELKGDFEWLNKLVADLKKQDNRRFYTTTTFTFQKDHGRWPEPNDDYFITQYTKKGWVRGQGVFNSEKPNFITDYSKSVEGIPVPLVTHEVGQYSVFPNLKEISKYTGVLDPLNFKAIKYDMEKKDLLRLSDSFKLASGKFAVNLYKEEIERALKTNNISGFQLLDLHDFPGQGTALVGLLDAFWDSKGLVEPKRFREFCSPVVPLLRFEKASYLNNENFKATVQIANFSNEKITSGVHYKVTSSSGATAFSGNLPDQVIDFGSTNIGELTLDLRKITIPEELTIQVSIPRTIYRNQWKFWVYPSGVETDSKKVIFTSSKAEAFKALNSGRTVVLNPDTSQIKGVNGRFTSVFWSPVHFPDQPGTMGILCNPKHPALAAFPTDFYSDWQWWDLITHSKTMVIDSLPRIQSPIVRVIDNFFKNRKMANIIEAKVGEGKLILCSMDITNNLDERIEAKQLRSSLIAYAASPEFNPKQTLTQEQLSYVLK